MQSTLLRLRNELDDLLRRYEGVQSVGIGKQGEEAILTVFVDPERFRGTVPKTYRGVKVRLEELFRPKLLSVIGDGT